ncbi:MAG: MBL fold metallo-hydrolase [Bacilli bacterium]|nr:MBL fold metallo-hydrolase [Bacilli bacterium]
MIKSFCLSCDEEFSSNTYIVGELGKSCVIIDLGTTSKQIFRFIKENFTDVKAILITHGHYDHIRGINKFINDFKDVPIFIDRYDEELLTNPRYNLSNSYEEPIIVLSKNIHTFKDQEILNFGEELEFKIIETPYHTEGSVCIVYEKENAIFTGDSLFKNSIGRFDLITANRRLIKSSLNIIKNFDPKYRIYPGHGELTTMKEELENNIYLKKEL